VPKSSVAGGDCVTQNFQLASPLSRAAVIDVTASVTWL